jgi:16S rRNA (adenine1518-N6/adenine1519-N6)-dimethyltransferase
MIKPIKELGQNFLRNEEVIEKIAQLLEINNGETILEIGPGEGVITKAILQNKIDFKLITIDIDPRSFEEVGKIKDSRLEVRLGNFLEQKISTTKIIGAIPYNITSPILHKIIDYEFLPKKVVLVIQKEVAEKITSKKGSYLKNYLSFYYDLDLEFIIAKENFFPTPKVDSAVVSLKLKTNQPNYDKKRLSNFLHKVFRSPRKKINKVFTKEHLDVLKIDENKRPEELTLKEIEILFNNEI